MRVTFEGSTNEMKELFGKGFTPESLTTKAAAPLLPGIMVPRQKRKYTRRNTRRVWTKEELAMLLSLYGQGKSFSRIGRILHRTSKAINVKLVDLRKSGVLQHRRTGNTRAAVPTLTTKKRAEPKRWTPQEEQKLIDLVTRGTMLKQDIAKALGRSPVSLSIKLHEIAKQRGWRKGAKGSWMPVA